MFADLVRTLHDVFFEEYGKYQLQKWQLISETQRSPGYSTLSHPSSFFFFAHYCVLFSPAAIKTPLWAYFEGFFLFFWGTTSHNSISSLSSLVAFLPCSVAVLH